MTSRICRKRSATATTPIGRPFSTIGMCRNSPTAILWIAIAIVSSWRRTTGSRVMKARRGNELRRMPVVRTTASRSVKMPASLSPSITRRQSTGPACIRPIASSRAIVAGTVSGGLTPRTSRCSPSSRPWKSIASLGRSPAVRSAPHSSHRSSPAKLSWWQTGQVVIRAVRLLDRPRLAASQQPTDVAHTALGHGRVGLGRHQLVVGGPADVPNHPDRNRELRPEDTREHECDQRVRLVMDEQVRLADPVLADPDDLGLVPVEPDPLVAVLAEDHRLAVLQDQHPVLADLPVGELAVGAIIEDVAV